MLQHQRCNNAVNSGQITIGRCQWHVELEICRTQVNKLYRASWCGGCSPGQWQPRHPPRRCHLGRATHRPLLGDCERFLKLLSSEKKRRTACPLRALHQVAIDHLASAPETGSSDIVNVVHRVLESVHGYNRKRHGKREIRTQVGASPWTNGSSTDMTRKGNRNNRNKILSGIHSDRSSGNQKSEKQSSQHEEACSEIVCVVRTKFVWLDESQWRAWRAARRDEKGGEERALMRRSRFKEDDRMAATYMLSSTSKRLMAS